MLIPKKEQPKLLQVHPHLLAQVKKCGGLSWISGNYPEAPALKEKMKLFYQSGTGPSRYRQGRCAKPTGNFGLPISNISSVLLSSAIIQFLSHDKD